MSENNKKFSVKKTLGGIGFIFYWGLQIPAVIDDPSVITSLTMENAIFVALLLGIKTAGGVLTHRNGGKVD